MQNQWHLSIDFAEARNGQRAQYLGDKGINKTRTMNSLGSSGGYASSAANLFS